MKKLKIYSFLLPTFALTLFSSCSKEALDKVNANRNNPNDVQAKFILTDVITSTAFSVAGGDISLYASVYVEHEAGVWGQMYNAETRTGEPVQSTTYNNSWGSIYQNIKGLKIVIAKTTAGGPEEGNEVTAGIAKVLLAYNLGVLTDFYGDAPYSEAGVINRDGSPAVLQPKIDQQSELYPQIQTLLDEALVLLEKTDAAASGAIGNQDLIYGGDKNKWIKAAHGLKARYLMHTTKRTANLAVDMEKVLDHISKAFTSSSDEFAFDHYDGTSNVNPLFGFSNARDAFGVSHSLVTKFKNLNDPRGGQAFMDYNFVQLSLNNALAISAPNGNPVQQQYVYPISIAAYATTAPTLLLSHHELMFLKTEALVRLNRKEEAKDALKSGIISAFTNLERTLNATNTAYGMGAVIDLSITVATAYYDNFVLPRFTANALEETMLQKYLAFYGASGESTEAFNDYRRLKAMGEHFITLENPLNANGKFPLRFTYGNSDVTANPAVKSAYGDGGYVFIENVWWAGGTR
jgi:hypothetical protein